MIIINGVKVLVKKDLNIKYYYRFLEVVKKVSKGIFKNLNSSRGFYKREIES